VGYPLQQANNSLPLTFTLVLSSDHITGATGVTPTVTIRKTGGSFATPFGAVTEIGSGQYQVAPNTVDSNTLGPLLLHAEATGCDPTDETFFVVNYNPTSFTPTTVPASIGSYTGRSIVDSAAAELGVKAQGQSLSPSDAELFLDIFSRIIDDWNAIRDAVFATEFLQFTMVPGTNPHTIGPSSADWDVDQRPVTIESAVVILSSGPSGVNAPRIRLHDQSVGIPSWFNSQATPNLTTSYPTDGYYDASWPNGSLYLWPVPSTAYGIQLQVRAVLQTYALNTVFSMPPGPWRYKSPARCP
jgi:hypothetical protein